MSNGVAIGTPAAGPPTWGYVDSLLRLQPPDSGGWVFLPPAIGLAIAPAHNWLVERFLETDCEWLLWLDADAKVHPATLNRLLSWGEPVVGALSFTRRHPVTPVVYAGEAPGENSSWIQIQETKQWLDAHRELVSREPAILDPPPVDSLRSVDFTGCHCLLVWRRVYEMIGYPWFESPFHMSTGKQSDRVFCEKMRALGVTIYVDRSVTTCHVSGETCTSALSFLAWDAITDWSSVQAAQHPL